MKWITASDITDWARTDQRNCQQLLPELVSLLVLASSELSNIQEIVFPSGDNISQGGWDGKLTTTAVLPHFPSGRSRWEIGAGESPGVKAEEDFRKRSEDPLDADPRDTTFVFVTPRPWPGRTAWVSAKRAEGPWKDVRVVGSNELNHWLDSAPAVALWLARKMGKPLTAGLQDLQSFWSEWSTCTTPVMTSELVVSGRVNEVEGIQEWLSGSAQVFRLQGDSPDEAIAFLYSVIDELEEPKKGAALSKCLVIQEATEFREIVRSFDRSLIIAASGSCVDAAGLATKRGHHVLLSIDSGVIDVGDDGVRLSRPRRELVEKALIQSGVSTSESRRLSREFGRSVPVLRRHMSLSQAVNKPEWAAAKHAEIVLPILLVGAWNEASAGDQEVVAAISSIDYDEFSSRLPLLLSMDDSPIDKIGNVWSLKSNVDAWFLIAPGISMGSLDNVLKVMASTLCEIDPRFDLIEKDRWAAGIYGKSREHSDLLRRGLAESLVLLGVFGDKISCVESASDNAAGCVRTILASLKVWQALASVQDILPLLAEAAPQIFLEWIERTHTENPGLFVALMSDEGKAIFGQCNHAGLLWAIESIAWSPDYFGLAVEVLVKLAGIDPGGNWSNRPINSLKDLFLPRRPQTYASPAERLAAMDRMIEANPALVWRFTKEFFTGRFVMGAHQFRWRDSGGERRGLEPESKDRYLEYVSGLGSRLGAVVRARVNLVDATANLMRLPCDLQQAVIVGLEALDPTALSREETLELNDKIRDALNWIGSHGDTEQRKIGDSLTPMLEKFAPENLLDRIGWLLSSPWPVMPDAGRYDEKQAAEYQEKAARELLDEVEISEILAFARTLEYPGVSGAALGRVVNDSQDNDVLDELVESDADNSMFFICYSSARFAASGSNWLSRHVQRFKNKKVSSAENYAYLYLGLPLCNETWTAVAGEGQEIERAYWLNAAVRPRPKQAEDAITAVEKLIWVGRSSSALEIAGDPQASMPISLLKKLLQTLLNADPESQSRFGDAMFTFYLQHIFRQLNASAEISIEELARIEWPFAALFDDLSRGESHQLAIHKLLAKDPLTFAELVSVVYKSDEEKLQTDDEEDNEAKGKRILLARNAHEVLSTWHLIPGTREDGSVDEKALEQWVDNTRKRCVETGHATGCDLQIAEMLSHSPVGEDKVWPHPAICDLLERLKNPLIEKHIPIGIYNSRGVTSRAVGEGGHQERAIAERYRGYAAATKVKWPRTSAMLGRIADSYERSARMEDVEAELDDFQRG